MYIWHLDQVDTYISLHNFDYESTFALIAVPTYVVGSKRFRPDVQKPRQMENAVRDI